MDHTPIKFAHHSLLNSLPDGVLMVDSEGLIAEINASGQRMLGKNADQMVGYPLIDVLPQSATHWRRARSGETVTSELQVVVDGAECVYELRISPIEDGTEYDGSRLITLRDITRYKNSELELKARQQLFENLVAVARATSEGATLQATLQNALDVTTQLTGAEYGSLFLLDSHGRVTHGILARGKTPPGPRRKIVGTVMDKGLAGWVVRHRKPALIADTVEDDRWVTLPNQPYAVRSVLAVPITSRADVPGVLTLQHSQPHHFSGADEELLRAASDQMALALRNAQIYEEQRRLADRQITLYEVLRTIGQHLEPNTVIHVAVETVRQITGWSAVAIVVPTVDGRRLIVEAAAGTLADAAEVHIPIDEGSCGRVYSNGTTLVISDGIEAGATPNLPQLNNAVLVPLRHAQQRLGVFIVQNGETGAFSDEDIRLAESLAEAVAMAVANARLFKAVTDEHSRLQALIQSSRDGIILIGVKQHILVVNDPALTYLNLYGEPEDWMYRPVQDALAVLRRKAPEIVRAAIAEIRRVGDTSGRGSEGEFEINSRTLRWLNLPVQTGDTPLGRLIVLEDVTKERALQRMRDDLTHTMVHDLRNPLNVVSGSLDILREQLQDLPSGEMAQTLKIARQSTKRMLNLINGILNISRLESGRMPLQRRSLDMAELITDVLDAQQPLAREKRLRLVYESDGVEPTVCADQELLERVMQNLVGNAIKFTPAEGIIRVRLDREVDALLVTVRDSGPGVPNEIRDQLFRKFVTGMHRERGSGLGLAFCRMAVEAHGGQIWLESDAEEGATFCFTIPDAAGNGNGREATSKEDGQGTT
ncbi:MAG TPA: GAF domain-containing protein [Candidatus Sulfomarinibacteraceae bacterium]|nr:GAF domain-containing protein [Candidatus Sulfomarinibacteraceae bacterium]